MIRTIKKYFNLLGAAFQASLLGIRYGKILHSGEDFSKNRTEALSNFQEFVPLPNGPVTKGHLKRLLWKNSVTRSFLCQLAFINYAVSTKGGHLSAPEKHVSYIRIPKSASTSMSLEMLEQKYPSLKQKNISEKEINFLSDVNLEKNCTEQNKAYIYFSIVRNPFIRLISVYRDFFENMQDNFIYRDYLFGILPYRLSFGEFINRIARIPDVLKDQHIKPQYVFLTYYQKQNVQCKIFKLEEPDKLITFLDSYQMKLPHLNRGSEPYDFRDYYTLTSLKKARKIYRVDIEMFGYEQAYNQIVDYLKTSSLSSH